MIIGTTLATQHWLRDLRSISPVSVIFVGAEDELDAGGGSGEAEGR